MNLYFIQLTAVKILAVEMPSETSELTCSATFHNCSHFLTKPLEKPLIESLGFPEFGYFHNSRFFMTNPLVLAVIQGLALMK